ncbi:trypsin-like serine protease [Neoconidiobolus thromboides FSU 785]|nr:trypsin-like serine protease [Neoconidiobolus thromboides FSU 785]
MFYILTLLLFLTFYYCFPIQSENLTDNSISYRIINGSPTSWKNHPSLVSIRTGSIHLCGGGLLSSNIVLTAAHCMDENLPLKVWSYYSDNSPSGLIDSRVLEEKELNEMKTEANSINSSSFIYNNGGSSLLGKGPNGSFTIHSIKEVILHPNYNKQDPFVNNDIAIVKLLTPSPVREYLLLDTDNLANEEGLEAQFAGWGRTDPLKYDSSSPSLLQTTLSIYSFEKCNKAYKDLNQMNHLCARHMEDKTSVCHGDSGSPLVIENKIIGIASLVINMKCLNKKFPSIFTKVNNYVDWINLNMY